MSGKILGILIPDRPVVSLGHHRASPWSYPVRSRYCSCLDFTLEMDGCCLRCKKFFNPNGRHGAANSPPWRSMNLAHHVTRSTPDALQHVPATEMLDEQFEYLCRRCGLELLPPMTAVQAKKFVKKHGARACEAKQ